jgi:TPR repeat protein
VFQRYGLLRQSFDAKEIIAQFINKGYLNRLIKWYKDDSQNEFDKMCSIVFLEIASDAGNPIASDRLYRYYTKGKHLSKDPDKASFYFERACNQGSADSLKDYFRSLRNDPEYESKAERYLKRIPKDGSLFLMIALIYRDHKDHENYLIWLEKAAKTAYTGAVTLWINYWSAKEPIEIDKIEMLNKFVLKKQLGAAHILADFYHSHQDICPGKFEWFIGELRKKDNIFVPEILRKYGLD